MVLAKLDTARQALMEAKTVEEVSELRDQAAVIASYLKRRDYSLECQNDAMELKIRAERKLGELTRAMEKAKGTVLGGNKVLPPRNTPTYADLGLKKMQVSRWQQAQELPEEVFEKHVAETRKKGDLLTSEGVRRVARDKARQVVVERELQPIAFSDLKHDLLCSDFQLVASGLGQFNAIITDIPYNPTGLECSRQLAEWAPKLLLPGGVLAVMCGQLLMLDVAQIIRESMHYRWTMAYVTPGGQSPQIWPEKINTFWKPVLLFTNGTEPPGRWLGDVVKTELNDNDKRFHEWGQSEGGFSQIIEKLTEPGDHVLDPFMGAGTTGVAALAAGRHFTGVDVDADAVAAAIRRIGDGTGDAG